MALKHITLTCPVCDVPSEAVGDPNRGSWYCFECRSHGSYQLNFTDVVEGPGVTADSPVAPSS